jgi:hypothetical protein
MNIRAEIDNYAAEADRPILHWLFDKYHWNSMWGFVTYCTWDRYGTQSYEVNRVWAPTLEGRILYQALSQSS